MADEKTADPTNRKNRNEIGTQNSCPQPDIKQQTFLDTASNTQLKNPRFVDDALSPQQGGVACHQLKDSQQKR